jgi:predicted dehydrogenase
MSLEVIIVGSGPWSTKISCALHAVKIPQKQIGYRDFINLNPESVSKLINNSIIWICTTPSNQISVVEKIANLTNKVILEKPLVTTKNEVQELIKFSQLSKNSYFISQLWTHSEMWSSLKKYILDNQILEILIERYGTERRTYFSPPLDWLPHDIYLLYDLYGNELLNSKLKMKRFNFEDTSEIEILIEKRPRIKIAGGFKNGNRSSKWTLFSKDEKFTFNFIDSSIEVYDFQSKIRKNLMVSRANSVERMVKAIHKTSQANDLETIIKVYDRYLV